MLPTTSDVTRDVTVGTGALVRAWNGGPLDRGAPFLIDPTGTSYALGEADTRDEAHRRVVEAQQSELTQELEELDYHLIQTEPRRTKSSYCDHGEEEGESAVSYLAYDLDQSALGHGGNVTGGGGF